MINRNASTPIAAIMVVGSFIAGGSTRLVLWLENGLQELDLNQRPPDYESDELPDCFILRLGELLAGSVHLWDLGR